MKKYTFLLLILLGFINLYSQSPNKMSYQVVVTDNFDRLVQTRLINVKISILQSSAEGALVYSENHIVTTDYAGVADIEIGNGNKSNGSFADLDWSKGPYFIKTEIDPDGGSNYITKGISELLSVPYSLYSKTADNVLNASYNDLDDKPEGKNKGDILYWNGEGWTIIPIGTPGQWLQINQEGVPFWADAYINEDRSSEAILVSIPTVTTTPATNINYSSGYTGGNVTNSGGTAVTSRGVCWNSTGNPTIADSHTTDGSGTGVYTSIVSSVYNTMVYVRAYATNSVGTAYGNQITLSTRTPSVYTNDAAAVTCNSAILSNYISMGGGTAMTECGVCYSTSSNPTMATRTSLTPGVGYNGSTVIGLLPNTMYYYKAYATNNCGTSYGTIKSFRTNAVASPTVETGSVTDILATSAQCSGNITTSNCSDVTSRGICWNTTGNPTILDNHTSNGTGIGSFSSTLSNLYINVTYYVRAYAANSIGVAYGNQITFSTNLPQCSITTVGTVTCNSAGVAGYLGTQGGSSVTERGYCYGTTSQPTIAGSHVNTGSGTGTVSATLTNLSPATKYYVRMYAINSIGISYGPESSFTTSPLNNPTVVTSTVSQITSTSAVCGGTISTSGCSVVQERGVCWGTSTNPVYSGNHTSNGNGLGTFVSTITGLQLNQTIHVRAYAKNGATITYGPDITFRTTLAVGDEYNLGKVAYILTENDPGYHPDYQKGLIVYEIPYSDYTWISPPYCNTYISTSDAYGYGSYNSDNIASKNVYSVVSASALGFVPSLDELLKISANRVKLGIPNGMYLSSSQDNSDQTYGSAYAVQLYTGSSNTLSVSKCFQNGKVIPTEYFSRLL